MSALQAIKDLLTKHVGLGKPKLVVVSDAAILAAGLPPSAVNHAAYWGKSNAAGKAARALGWEPHFKGGVGVKLVASPALAAAAGLAEPWYPTEPKTKVVHAEVEALPNLGAALAAVACTIKEEFAPLVALGRALATVVVGRRARLREAALHDYEGVLTADDLRGYGTVTGWRSQDTVTLLILDGALTLNAGLDAIELEETHAPA